MPHPISDHARRFVPASITDHLLAHAGRPAIVIGGGPSVPWYFVQGLSPALPPDNAVIISANGHGCRLAEYGVIRRPDYVVAVDDNLEDELRPYGVPIISQRDYSDIQLWQKPVHSSGQLGCYVAWLMGCAPIIPYGMDLYAAGAAGVYYDAPTAASAGVYVPADQHLEHWTQCVRAVADSVVRVPAGSPLTALFPAYDSRETFAAASAGALEARQASAAGHRVVFIRKHPRTRGGGHYQVGDVVTMTAKDARRLQREHVARMLDTIPESA